jgi:hypothetical protein
MTTVTASRIVPADPASTALLLAGPSALEFWPGVTEVDGVLSPLSARAALAGDSQRRVVVRSQPPRRTATAYITTFVVDADGLPSASGVLRVTGQDWLGGSVVPEQSAHRGGVGEVHAVSASIQLELRTDVDYDAGVEQEIAAAAQRFLDNIAAFAGDRAVPA